VPFVVPKNRTDQARVEFAIGLGISPADPSVSLYTFHILGEYDPNQFIDPFVRIIAEEIVNIGRWTNEHGQVFLHEYVGAGKRSKK